MRRTLRWMLRHAAELLTGTAWLVGWILCTAAVERRSLWLGSLGLLSVSLGGWRLLFVIVRDGLYTLTRDGR